MVLKFPLVEIKEVYIEFLEINKLDSTIDLKEVCKPWLAVLEIDMWLLDDGIKSKVWVSLVVETLSWVLIAAFYCGYLVKCFIYKHKMEVSNCLSGLVLRKIIFQ